MTLIQLLIDFLLGAAIGFLGGLFGIGGGLIAIPILTIFFGFDQQLAQGTALLMVVPNVLITIRNYNRYNKINWRYATALSIPSFFLAFAGSYIALSLNPRYMQISFAVFLIIVASYTLLYTLLRRNALLGSKESRYGLPALAFLGGSCGFLGGLFVVGASILATPMLTIVFGLSQLIAQGLALTQAVPSLLASLSMYMWHGQVSWAMGLPLAIGGLTTVVYGVRLAHHIPQKLLKILFSLFLMVCAILLLIK